MKQEKKAKYQLTILLPNEIHYGHTIDEAEKVDAISDAMEFYAEQKAGEFINFILEGGWRHLEDDDCWSNGERHCTVDEMWELFMYP